MKKIKDLYKKYLIPFWTIVGVGAVFLVWWIVSLIANTTLFPGPQVVIPQFFAYLSVGQTYEAVGWTLLRLLISVTLGFIFGLGFGIIAGLHPSFRAFMRPFIIVFRTIPTAAVMFVIIALLKPMFAPIIIVFLIIFPIMYDSVVTGFTNIDKTLINVTKIDEKSHIKSVFKIYLPLSWNYILLGLISSIGLGMKVSIMSEIIAGSDSALGLGKLIRDCSTIADIKGVLAYSLIAIVLIGLIDIGLHFVKKRFKKEKEN